MPGRRGGAAGRCPAAARRRATGPRDGGPRRSDGRLDGPGTPGRCGEGPHTTTRRPATGRTRPRHGRARRTATRRTAAPQGGDRRADTAAGNPEDGVAVRGTEGVERTGSRPEGSRGAECPGRPERIGRGQSLHGAGRRVDVPTAAISRVRLAAAGARVGVAAAGIGVMATGRRVGVAAAGPRVSRPVAGRRGREVLLVTRVRRAILRYLITRHPGIRRPVSSRRPVSGPAVGAPRPVVRRVGVAGIAVTVVLHGRLLIAVAGAVVTPGPARRAVPRGRPESCGRARCRSRLPARPGSPRPSAGNRRARRARGRTVCHADRWAPRAGRYVAPIRSGPDRRSPHPGRDAARVASHVRHLEPGEPLLIYRSLPVCETAGQ